MSAKAVTEDEGMAREAVLHAMQEAAESAAGKNGVPKGPKGTRGVVMLSNDVSWTSPDDKKKKNKWDRDVIAILIRDFPLFLLIIFAPRWPS